MNSWIILVPARLKSQRLKEKALVDLGGKPLIIRVCDNLRPLSKIGHKVIVATDSSKILKTCQTFGHQAIMTSSTHNSGTDRIWEVAQTTKHTHILNVQGDEPLVYPEMFQPLVQPLIEDNSLNCVNLMAEISNEREFYNQNVVKVVCDLQENAMFFSREPIPSLKMYSSPYKKYKQLGIYAFRKEFLFKFTKLSPTPMEIIESVDMLRLLENGYNIRMVKIKKNIVGVDTPDDMEKVKKIMLTDPLKTKYQ